MKYRRAVLLRRDDDSLNCGSGGGDDADLNLRVASIFIIMVGSFLGSLFPVLSKRTRWLGSRIPKSVFDFAKYFGSGVIIATAFIHLLDPAIEELGSPCLSPGWSEYPYALAIALVSIFLIFIVEIVAFRWGSAKLARLGIAHDPHGHDSHGHDVGITIAHGPGLGDEPQMKRTPSSSQQDIVEKPRDLEEGPMELAPEHVHHGEKHHQGHGHGHAGAFVDSAVTQILGVAILEFGVLLHSFLVGLTLAVTEDFKVLFVVIVFHQTFEGLGVGSRLADMELPPRYNFVPILSSCIYGITTPIGIAIGLGIRSTYNPGSTTASIVSGVLDAFSAGILIYTGLVELLAHEFLFSKEMMESSNGRLCYALGCMMLGCALMALLGRWA